MLDLIRKHGALNGRKAPLSIPLNEGGKITMMRSLYSGVAGLKTHQTKMDVLGNNIANTNTVGFKSSAVNFSDTFYQTISSATGANADLGTAGVNAKQIGLGSMVASITTNITEQGGPSTTNRALDIAINGESFLIVRSGSDTCFTKSGALNVDEAGNLYCTTNGATVQGWLADDDGNIIKDTVQDLKVMSSDKQYYEPEATTAATISGNIDPNDPDVDATTGNGEIVTFSFFDNIGESYTVKVRMKKGTATEQTAADKGNVLYKASLVDVYNAKGESIFTTCTNGIYAINTSAKVTFGNNTTPIGGTDAFVTKLNTLTGDFELACPAVNVFFDQVTGAFKTLEEGTVAKPSGTDKQSVKFSVIGVSTTNTSEGTTAPAVTSSFPQVSGTSPNITGGIDLYFNTLTQYEQGGTSKLNGYKGNPSKTAGVGNKAGKMTGLSIDEEGKVWANYDNGLKKCMAQIAVATFANPSGLEAVGNSLFQATLNSGEFDGIGEEVKLTGSFTVGALEMSNVDLANEFVNMITTQRGFQANSRIITTSDSMLEELVNLKR
ncbi:flagellar hook-basal body complex protein [bacterium D16-51]|nr:flagellar hook-basal body complex protein [bacterium D16-59]RKI61904.1 flagellar hook-basal body complex protein [bacterium D16-51]